MVRGREEVSERERESKKGKIRERYLHYHNPIQDHKRLSKKVNNTPNETQIYSRLNTYLLVKNEWKWKAREGTITMKTTNGEKSQQNKKNWLQPIDYIYMQDKRDRATRSYIIKRHMVSVGVGRWRLRGGWLLFLFPPPPSRSAFNALHSK